MNNKDGGTYGKVMLTGMYLLHEDENRKDDPPPKAMIIVTGESNDSMSRVSTTSKSTQGHITWDKNVDGKELTCESVFANERKKNMKQIEVENWIKHNIEDKRDPIHQWNMKQIQECVEYDKWKQMIIDIKNERKRMYKEINKKNEEFNNPELDAAISNMPSYEI